MTTKSLHVTLGSILLGLTVASFQPAFAVSSFSTNATYGATSNPAGPATTGSILSETIVPESDGTASDSLGNAAYARGAADDTGAGAVAVDGIFWAGGSELNSLTELSVLTSEITNDTGGVAYFSYNFYLPGPQLSIADFAGMSETDPSTITAFFDFRVSIDLGSGYLPYIVSQGELKGSSVSHTLGTEGTVPLGSTYFSDGNIFGYQFDNLEDTIKWNNGRWRHTLCANQSIRQFECTRS